MKKKSNKSRENSDKKSISLKNGMDPEWQFGLKPSGIKFIDLICQRMLAAAYDDELDIVSYTELCFHVGITPDMYNNYMDDYPIAEQVHKIFMAKFGERREKEIRKFKAPIAMLNILPRYNKEYAALHKDNTDHQIELVERKAKAVVIAQREAPLEFIPVERVEVVRVFEEKE